MERSPRACYVFRKRKTLKKELCKTETKDSNKNKPDRQYMDNADIHMYIVKLGAINCFLWQQTSVYMDCLFKSLCVYRLLQ